MCTVPPTLKWKYSHAVSGTRDYLYWHAHTLCQSIVLTCIESTYRHISQSTLPRSKLLLRAMRYGGGRMQRVRPEWPKFPNLKFLKTNMYSDHLSYVDLLSPLLALILNIHI